MYFSEKKIEMDRVSCTCAMLHPLLYSHDDPLISFFSKDVIFQGLGYTVIRQGPVAMLAPGTQEFLKALRPVKEMLSR